MPINWCLVLVTAVVTHVLRGLWEAPALPPPEAAQEDAHA